MERMLETAAWLLVLVCFCWALCLLYSLLVQPYRTRDTWVVVWGRGRGEELEQRVRALMWLRECGLLRANVVVADGSLTEEGRQLVWRLQRRWPQVALCPGEQLAQFMGS